MVKDRGMSIGAITPVSAVRPRQGSTDGPGHQAEHAVDRADHQPDHRRHHKHDPDQKPPSGEAAPDTTSVVDQLA